MEDNVENKQVINKTDKKKMDSKTKKVLLFIGIILFVIGIIILFCVAIFGSKEENNKKPVQNNTNKVGYTNKTYFIYMDIKPALKLEVEERYNKCTTGECLYEIVLLNYKVIEYDEKGVFDNYKIVEKNELNNSLNDIIEHARSKGVDTSNIDFYGESYEIADYLNLDNGLYGYYYSDITNPDDFYSRYEENIDDEEVPIEPIVKKEYLIKDATIFIKNVNNKYSYNLTKKYDVKISINGCYNDVSAIDKDRIEFYVDVKGLGKGTHDLELKYDNYLGLDIEVELEPTEVEVVVVDKNGETTTTSTTTTTTKKTTTTTKKTTTTTSRNDVEINLNDNVQYFDVTSCGGYLSIKKECVNATIGELKVKYPDYNKELDTEEYFKDSIKLDTYQITYYFPGCEKTITSDTKNKLSKKQGFYMEFKDAFMRPYWIQFKDDRYVKFEWQIADFTSEDLYYSANCGGGDSSEINYKTLDEVTCTKYNLPCARW